MQRLTARRPLLLGQAAISTRATTRRIVGTCLIVVEGSQKDIGVAFLPFGNRNGQFHSVVWGPQVEVEEAAASLFARNHFLNLAQRFRSESQRQGRAVAPMVPQEFAAWPSFDAAAISVFPLNR